jgi:hypothetical protein
MLAACGRVEGVGADAGPSDAMPPPTCSNGSMDPDETAADCGGPCEECELGEGCLVAGDCESGFCHATNHLCVATHCENADKDGNETDVDCGGSTCDPCSADSSCSQPQDCTTGVCAESRCQLASGPPNWLAFTPLGGARSVGSAATLDSGHVFYVSGNYDPAGAITDSVQVFDPVAGMWVTSNASLPGLPTPRVQSAAAVGADGRVHVVGGVTSTPASTGVHHSYGLPLAPGTPWQSHTAMSVRSGHLLVLTDDGELHAIGGVGGLDLHEAWAGTDWSPRAAMPTGRGHLAGARGPDGRIYAIGGALATNADAGIVEAYNPTTDQWATVAPLPDERALLAAGTGADARIYAVGGQRGSSVLGTVEAYTPATNTWTSVAPLAQARRGLAVTLGPDGRLLALGGDKSVANDQVNTVEAYGPVITLSANGGPKGMPLMLTGSNFAANATVRVFFDRSSGMSVASGVTDAAGALLAPIMFLVPDSAVVSTTYRVTAVDGKSQYPVFARFAVTP